MTQDTKLSAAERATIPPDATARDRETADKIAAKWRPGGTGEWGLSHDITAALTAARLDGERAGMERAAEKAATLLHGLLSTMYAEMCAAGKIPSAQISILTDMRVNEFRAAMSAQSEPRQGGTGGER